MAGELLKGKAAVVTGASSGIGLASMRALAEQGVYVLGVARDPERLTAAVESVHPDFRRHVTVMPADVAEESAVERVMERAEAQFGKIDIVVNAAGVSMRGKQLVQDLELEEWKRILDTNLTGTFLICREALRRMTRRNEGYIVNILSTAAFAASGGDSAYSASKFGVRALTEALVSAHRSSGIRVSSISPGAVNTNIWDHKTKPVSQEKREAMLKPEDIADIVLFLLSRPPSVHIDNMTVTSWNR